jgi:hypothetical protein
VPVKDYNLAVTDPASPDKVIQSSSSEALKAVATDPALNEDLALALLQKSDLPPEVLDQLSKNASVVKSRKAKLAIVGHPRTPRYVSIALLRQFFTFDLMKVGLTPVIPGDLKAAAEELLIKRLESLSCGERISLARRASARVAGALLLDAEARVIQAALHNPRLTEAQVIKSLMLAGSPAILVRSVCEHPKWSLRREIRLALLRNDKTPISFVEKFAAAFPTAQLRDILQTSRLPESVKASLLKLDKSPR